MTRRITQEVSLMDDGNITASSYYRNRLFKPWFDDNNWGVEIIDGFYRDTVVQFKGVEFIEGGEGNVSLDYHIIYKPSVITEEDIKSDEFNNLLALIIEDIIKEAMETDEIRNNNTQESSS